jgi:hypothetical protein
MNDPAFASELRTARDKAALAFHTIEAVRVTLAKHELPRGRGAYAAAPGYGRIDMATGSIYWQVELGGDEVTIVSRRQIADACRALSRPNDRILSVPIQELVKPLPNEGYGLKRVAVTLENGSEYHGVRVAWGIEVVGVIGYDAVPFDVASIVDVRHDPAPERGPDADPF